MFGLPTLHSLLGSNGPVSEPVPRSFQHRLRAGVAAEVVCALSGSLIHAQPTFSASCHPQLAENACDSAVPATKSIFDLAKVHLYLTLRKCCACHAIQTLRNLRAAVPMGPSPNPFQDRSETVAVQASQPRWLAQFTHSATVSASCHPPARRECLRKCCASNEIYA